MIIRIISRSICRLRGYCILLRGYCVLLGRYCVLLRGYCTELCSARCAEN